MGTGQILGWGVLRREDEIPAEDFDLALAVDQWLDPALPFGRDG